MTRFDDDTLEAAAQLLEKLAGNKVYESAWRAGAKKIRALKILKTDGQKLNDSLDQISSSSQ